ATRAAARVRAGAAAASTAFSARPPWRAARARRTRSGHSWRGWRGQGRVAWGRGPPRATCATYFTGRLSWTYPRRRAAQALEEGVAARGAPGAAERRPRG